MLKKCNIRWKITLVAFSVVVLIDMLLSLYFYWNIYNKSQEDIHQIEHELIEIKKNELQSVTNIVFSSIESAAGDLKQKSREKLQANLELVFALLEARYQEAMSSPNPQIALQNTKRKIINEFRKLRFDQSGYLWIHSYSPHKIDSPRMIMHPFFPQINGKDISDFKYTDGKNKGEIIYASGINDSVPFFVQMNRVVKKFNEGFVEYQWPKPGLTEYQPKTSCVRLFKPFGWVIGVGAYINDIEPEIKKEALEIIRNFRYGPDMQEYFWINSYHPDDSNRVEMIMHPIITELEGSDMSQYRYQQGKKKGEIVYPLGEDSKIPFMVKINHIVKQYGDGIIQYDWPRPTIVGLTEIQAKLSYFKLFPQWNWVVGTGVYLEDIEKVKRQKMISLESQTSNFVLATLFISLAGLFFSFVIINHMSSKLVAPIHLIIRRMKAYAKGDHTLSELPVSNDEFDELSEAFSELRRENINLLSSLQREVDERTAALAKEKQLTELKSAFINTISHEYRTPLTAISSATMILDMLLKQNKMDTSIKYIQNINLSVKTLSYLVEDVLDYDRIQNKEYKPEPVPINIIEFCKGIVAEVRLLDENMHLIKFRYDREKMNFLADPKFLRQVLLQTLKNAVKYSPAHSDVIVQISMMNGNLQLEISDNGIGLPATDLEQIFTPFYKDERSIGLSSGNGLGLAIVKQYMDFFGGKIDIRSQENEGSKFTYLIPKLNQKDTKE